VPAYFHPDVAPAAWAALTGAGVLRYPAADRSAAYRGVSFVVLNVADGPDTWRQEPFARVAGALHAAGVPLVGYLDTGYGRRPAATIREEAGRYRDWYGITGAFLDQVRPDPEGLPQTLALTQELRADGTGLLVLNHGTHPDEAYARLADILVTFEGPAAAHRGLVAPSWVWRHPPKRFCHLVYATPEREVAAVIEHADRLWAGTVYVTDGEGTNPWGRLPGWLR
jgi:hypothetical protein